MLRIPTCGSSPSFKGGRHGHNRGEVSLQKGLQDVVDLVGFGLAWESYFKALVLIGLASELVAPTPRRIEKPMQPTHVQA